MSVAKLGHRNNETLLGKKTYLGNVSTRCSSSPRAGNSDQITIDHKFFHPSISRGRERKERKEGRGRGRGRVEGRREKERRKGREREGRAREGEGGGGRWRNEEGGREREEWMEMERGKEGVWVGAVKVISF